ncbi:hypothetical protein [Alteraurantiacibacter buctensis]|uniref:Uncharacterized protein n=1 Tax=Alteraurantiacibacter buctensis TaxID=1503981 RepID=A0A844YY55_9SPHN|nr:hypothetical protein [Alteraurantiacibacter buctensis]MXO73265.1 hypothetical protein [Alteraurantiacibacter buctensis]
MSRKGLFATTLALLALAAASPAAAQRGAPPPPASAREGAPVDLTGQWVAVVTEDWRWRMVTPPVGDTASVPLTAAGLAAAQAWDLAADNAAGEQCRAFGAGGIMRMPGRLRIGWQDDNTLKVETDRGQQTRLLRFIATGRQNLLPQLDDPLDAPEAPSWQGHTRAQWFHQAQSRGLGFGGPPPSPGGSLRAFTQNLRPGYLRLNGVPYSGNATVTEHFNLFEAGGTTWLVVTTIVEDPENLMQPFVTSSNFRKEADASRWAPTPCYTAPPAAIHREGE